MKKWNLLTAILLTAAMTVAMLPGAAAAGSDSSKRDVDLEKDRGTIDVVLKSPYGNPQAGIEITIYQVGTGRIEDGNLYFDLVEALRPAEGEDAIDLNGLSAAANTATAAKLQRKLSQMDAEQFVDGSQPGAVAGKDQILAWAANTDEKGVASFKDLPVGVYLVVQTGVSDDYYNITSFLAYLPMTNEEGDGWDYAVEIDPKLEARPGGGGGDKPEPPIDIPDPEPPKVEPPEPPIEVLDPEPEPPIDIPDPETPKGELPQTGMLQWPIPLMAMAGLVLFSLGWLKEQKSRKADD